MGGWVDGAGLAASFASSEYKDDEDEDEDEIKR